MHQGDEDHDGWETQASLLEEGGGDPPETRNLGERVSDEVLEAEYALKQLHDQIIELHQARKWEEYDRTQERIQVLVGRCLNSGTPTTTSNV